MTKRKEKCQGMNWIRKEKRLAIYLRDGMACCYCDRGIEDEVRLTLDHVTPYIKGGSNDESNLVTSCHQCNSSRGTRPMRTFVNAVAAYRNHGCSAEEIIAHINRTRKRKLDIESAVAMIERRGGFTACLESMRTAA